MLRQGNYSDAVIYFVLLAHGPSVFLYPRICMYTNSVNLHIHFFGATLRSRSPKLAAFLHRQEGMLRLDRILGPVNASIGINSDIVYQYEGLRQTFTLLPYSYGLVQASTSTVWDSLTLGYMHHPSEW